MYYVPYRRRNKKITYLIDMDKTTPVDFHIGLENIITRVNISSEKLNNLRIIYLKLYGRDVNDQYHEKLTREYWNIFFN